MGANWIFGLLAIMLVLDHFYKRATGKSLHHSAPQPFLWALVTVSCLSAASCFALVWNTFTSPTLLLMGPSSFWLLLGICLTGLSILWLLPPELAPDQKDSNQPLISIKQLPAARSSTPRTLSHEADAAPASSPRARPPAPFSAASLQASHRQPPHRRPSHRQPPHRRASAPIFASQREVSVPSTPSAAQAWLHPSPAKSKRMEKVLLSAMLTSQETIFKAAPPSPPATPNTLSNMAAGHMATRPKPPLEGAWTSPQLFAMGMVAIVLLAVGWQLGHIFALASDGPTLALTLPLDRPTPTPTAVANVSLTEGLIAQGSPNISSRTLSATPVTKAPQRIAVAPTTTRNSALTAKPAFEVASGKTLVEFRRADKSKLTAAPADAIPDARQQIIPMGGAIAGGIQNGSQPVQLLAPVDGFMTPGVVTLRWSADFELPDEQHYEVVAWVDGQEPSTQGISLAPLTSNTQVQVDLALLGHALGGRFSPDVYHWGVMLVQRSPYQRIALLSNTQTLYYLPSN